MFLSAVVQVDLTTAELTAPDAGLSIPVVVGREGRDTPEGIYLVRRMHSDMLQQDVLVFMQDGREVFAIHENLVSRNPALANPNPDARRLSAGCIGVSRAAFRRLWALKQQLVLQIYRSRPR